MYIKWYKYTTLNINYTIRIKIICNIILKLKYVIYIKYIELLNKLIPNMNNMINNVHIYNFLFYIIFFQIIFYYYNTWIGD